jgi:hypothetical protein
MALEDGPYLQAACFCEMVIQDKDGTLSLIKIVDRVNYTAMGVAPPDEMQPFTYYLKLVLMLKSGRATGSYEVKIVPELPSGIMLKDFPYALSVHFEGEDRGHNLLSDLRYTFEQPGLYWFHVFLDDELWTKLPLRVIYSRITTGPPRSP